ncbi:hypothetical protein BJY04DRAFT_179617 [Aspergillus karnatakaensis]|uniref:Zn(II)2Cys6 transcription factor domain-containing protein n=1 Tax=Aspergillus karnatakaensis TaxID=1810916 RepID=UPI003CCD6A93
MVNSQGSASPLNPVPLGRVQKRSRDDLDDIRLTHQSTRQRLRASIACGTCRDRKTKCDGRRPVCGYCERTDSACQFDPLDGYTASSTE